MKIENASIHVAKLSLKKSFKHGSFDRKYNETIFLKLTDGRNVGYGESLPRGYVTGEKTEDVIGNLRNYVSKIKCKDFKNLEDISEFLNGLEGEGSRNMASLCGLDMALLDLYSKNKNRSVSEVLWYELGCKERGVPKITSGPLGLDSGANKKDFYCLVGLNDIKVKIDSNTDPKKINEIGSGLIKPKSLRLDGNCSFSPDELREFLQVVNVNVDYIEQPFRVGVKEQIDGVKMLADESLVSVADAKDINFDAASIRIGKNGGILRTLQVIKEWERRDKPYMLGSLVGESSLLSSALMHVAKLSRPFLIEGCYSNRVLKTDPTNIHPSVKFGGRVNFDFSNPGLGVNLDLSNVESKKIEIN